METKEKGLKPSQNLYLPQPPLAKQENGVLKTLLILLNIDSPVDGALSFETLDSTVPMEFFVTPFNVLDKSSINKSDLVQICSIFSGDRDESN